MSWRRSLFTLALCLLAAASASADPPKKLLLVSQGPDGHPAETHEYAAGIRVLAKCLSKVPGLEITVSKADGPWKEGPDLLSRADGVVLFVSEGAKWIDSDPERRQAFAKLARRGGGISALHWAIGTRDARPIDGYLQMLGGCHGGPDRKYKVVEAEALVADPKHPITAGIANFRVKDEFYYHLKFVKPDGSVRPVLQVPIEGQNETVAWSWERPGGGRSFGFSGLHFHNNWKLPAYRRLVAQGVLWTFKLPIPREGLAVDVTDDDLKLTERRPNVIFILADDLGWTDLGCMGSKYYETPAIDQLARQGMKFTSYSNCQNCAPTRAALMSGQYAPRTGIYTVGTLERGNAQFRKMNVPQNQTELPLNKITIANVLKQSGYATAMFGKWHLGQSGQYHPSQRGFDQAIVSMGRHFDFATTPRVEVPPGTYLADFLTDQAVHFIEQNKDRPFFLYVPHFGVHSPHQAKKELIAKYEKKPGVDGHHSPVYAAMIDSVDQSVGRILAKLDELKLADNTVVLFSSDNGGVGGYQATGVSAKGITDNAPLRGGKGMLYEGGVRVPFVVRWPGVVKPGSVCAQPAIHVDIFPTFLELAGAKPPANQPLDGVSLVPVWKNAKARLPREAVFAHFPGYLEGGGPGQWRTTPAGSIRAGDFKLLEFFEDGRLELYNLKEDIGERTNLAGRMPDRTRELHAQLVAWRKTIGAAMPTLKEAKGLNK